MQLIFNHKDILNHIYRILFVFGLVLINNVLFAQQLPTDPPCGGPFDPCVPIDGGVGFLISAGIIYGSKKMLDIKKKAE